MQASTRQASSRTDWASSKPILDIHRGLLLTNRNSRLSELVETISKKPIPDHQKNVIFEMTVEDQTEEDVEVPYVMLKLRK